MNDYDYESNSLSTLRHVLKVSSITLALFLLLTLLIVETTAFGDLIHPVFDRYDKICIPWLTIVRKSTRCEDHLKGGNIEIKMHPAFSDHNDQQSYSLSYDLTDEISTSISVKYFTFSDYISLAIFLIGLAWLIHTALINEGIENKFNLISWSMFLTLFFLKFLYYASILIEERKFIDHSSFISFVLILSLCITASFFALIWSRAVSRTWVFRRELFYFTLSILGFSIFLKYVVVESKVKETSVFISINDHLGEFSSGQFTITPEHKSRLRDLVAIINDAQDKFKQEADTLIIEGHSDNSPVINPNDKSNIDFVISDDFGRLKNINEKTEIPYRSNIELAYLRAYAVWNYLWKEQKEANILPKIKYMYIASFSHHMTSDIGKKTRYSTGDVFHGQRDVVIRLEQSKYRR